MRKTFTSAMIALAATIALTTTPALAQPPSTETRFELIGQVLNPSPQASQQYGYLTYINGLGLSSVFAQGAPSEKTALFTFFNDTKTDRVINSGPQRIVNRTGKMTVTYDSTPDGNFTNLASFQDGAPVLAADLRHQVVLDTVQGRFVSTFDLTVTNAESFDWEGKKAQLAKPGDKIRLVVYGIQNPSGPAQFVMAGNAW